jgi:hypothetical protein
MFLLHRRMLSLQDTSQASVSPHTGTLLLPIISQSHVEGMLPRLAMVSISLEKRDMSNSAQSDSITDNGLRS